MCEETFIDIQQKKAQNISVKLVSHQKEIIKPLSDESLASCWIFK